MFGLLAAVGSLASGCGRYESDFEATPEGGAAGGYAGGADGDAGESPAPGAGLPRMEPPGLGWSLRDETPSGRWGEPVIVDTTADRLLVLGPDSSEIWALALSGKNQERWSQLELANSGPAQPLSGGVYDPDGNRFFTLVNGSGADLDYADMQLWELSLGAEPRWQLTTFSGPAPGEQIYQGVLALDARGRRLFALGGHNGGCGTWSLALDGDRRWSRLADSPSNACQNGPGYTGSNVLLTFDEPRERLVLLGLAEDWELPLASPSWSSLGRSFNGGGFGARIHDPSGERIISVSLYARAVFSLEDDEWQELEATHEVNDLGSAALDPSRERIVFFSDFGSAWANATWQLPLESLKLEALTPNTRGASRSELSVNVFDPVRQAVVAFGGVVEQTLTRSLEPGASWERFDSVRGTDQGAIYDPVGQAIVAFDGPNLRRLGSSREEWEWTSIPSGPTQLLIPVSAFDEARRRLLIFGGLPLKYSEERLPLGDIWSLDLDGEPAWTKLMPTGEAPALRKDRLGVYDAAADRLVVYGGWLDPEAGTDLRMLSLGEEPNWTPLEASGAPPELRQPSAVYDPDGRRMIVVDVSAFGTNVVALELTEPPQWHRFCSLGTQPGRSVYDASAVLTTDGLDISVRDAAYRFDLNTPYCD